MGIAALVKYDVYFANAGQPATGLAPISRIYNRETGTYTSGIVAESGRGWYVLYISGTAIGSNTHVGYVDAGSASLSVADRFVPVRLDPYDYAVDGYITDIPPQLAAEHGLGVWASGTELSTAGNLAVAQLVNTLLTANHGSGIWTSGTATVVDNWAIASAVKSLLNAQHGTETWVTSGIETALNNIQGTGFVSANDSLKVISAAIAAAGPVATVATSGLLSSGVSVTGSYVDTQSLNTVYWQTTPDGTNVLDQQLIYNAGPGKVANSVHVYGRYQVAVPTAGKAVNLYAWNYATSAWDSISTAATRMNGQNSTTDNTYTYPLLAAHMSTAGEAKIRFVSLTNAITSNLYLDYVPFYYQTTGSTTEDIANAVYNKLKYTVYDNGVWIDSLHGTDGTEIGTNGLYNTPCRTYADAYTIATTLGVKRFYLKPDTTIALTHDHGYWRFIGKGNILLNNQNIEDAVFEDSELVSGVATGDDATFTGCVMDSVTLGGSWLRSCAIRGTFTTIPGSSYAYLFKDCVDGAPGSSTPTLVLHSNAQVGLRNWRGGLQLNAMDATNAVAIDGAGRLLLDASNTGGELRVRGTFDVTDAVPGGFASVGTYIETANFNRPKVISDANTALIAAHGGGSWVTSGIDFLSAALSMDDTIQSNYERPTADFTAYVINVTATSGHGDMTDPDDNFIGLYSYTAGGTSRTSMLYKDVSCTTPLDDSTEMDYTNYKVLMRSTTGQYYCFLRVASDTTLEDISAKFRWKVTVDGGQHTLTRGGVYRIVTNDASTLRAQLAAEHGTGSWVTSGIETALTAVNTSVLNVPGQLTAQHGLGTWTSGSSTVTVDNWAIADAVNQIVTANHGLGIWVSGTVVDAATIAAAVDAVLTTNHGAGSWTSTSGGSGANAVSVGVVDTGAAPIAGVMVNVYNATETTLIAYGTTNTLGAVGFLLDNGTYKVRLAKYTAYTFTNPQTLTVAGTTSATYVGTAISGPLPPTVETCVISGRCVDGVGNVLKDVQVSAKVIGSQVVFKDTNNNVTSVASQPLSTASDANGVWYLTLIRSAYLYDSADSAGVQYRFRVKGRGLDENKDVTVPNAATAKYEEL